MRGFIVQTKVNIQSASVPLVIKKNALVQQTNMKFLTVPYCIHETVI